MGWPSHVLCRSHAIAAPYTLETLASHAGALLDDDVKGRLEVLESGSS